MVVHGNSRKTTTPLTTNKVVAFSAHLRAFRVSVVTHRPRRAKLLRQGTLPVTIGLLPAPSPDDYLPRLPTSLVEPARKESGLTAESTRTRAARADGALAAPAVEVLPDALAWRSINAVRALAMDAVEAAQSGHPGTPMALAPAAYVLWHRFLKYDPRHPDWPDRDRFVLSCGHASKLLYALLYLSGYDVSLDDI
jgi:hypothetical protein